MLDQVISKLSQNFIDEAKNSPNLLEDMAAMEKYMSESYDGRIFVELLQNADDSGSKNILLTEYNEHIIFANDGRCFNENDVIAISRSGSSSKERGATIGYRGIGFKSTTYLTKEIIIYSSNTYFTFSKSMCSKALGKSEAKIPTIRIPFLVNNIESNIGNYVQNLKSQGYRTVFIFKNAKMDRFIEELYQINNGYFLFLHNICNCSIDLGNYKNVFRVERDWTNNNLLVHLMGHKAESWLLIRNNKTSIAFKYDSGKIIPCSSEEAVYHCYLPTFDKVAFPIKINSDFSTDPSRKHLTTDEITSESIECAANLLFHIISQGIGGKNNQAFSNILLILLQTNGFSKANSLLKAHLKERIISSKWLTLNNGNVISSQEYKVLPDWLENSEKDILRKKSNFVGGLSLNSEVYTTVLQVENFLSQFSTSKYTTEELISIMEEEQFAASINAKTYGKILAHIIKVGKADHFISGKEYNHNNIAIKTDEGVSTLNRISRSKKVTIAIEAQEILKQIVSNDDIDWFCKKTGVNPIALKSIEKSRQVDNSNIRINQKISRPVVSKWRSAEQQCIELERYLGNSPIDVSKQNVGYDVESVTPAGEKRYIEVKSLSSDGGSFSITNNEYTAAHQYGDKYYICLITQSDKESKVVYICNPLKKLKFEKRIRQWEWYCEQYGGVEYVIDIK